MYGPVDIGKNVMMGPDVVVLTTKHIFKDIDTPMIQQGSTGPHAVTIADDVWIGERAVILPGINIGCGAIVGTCAVVTKNVPPYAIVAGNPAIIIRYRKNN